MPNRDRGWPGKGEKVSFEQKGENGPRVHNETQGKLCKRRKTDKGKAQVRREESAFAQGVWPESRETGGDRGRGRRDRQERGPRGRVDFIQDPWKTSGHFKQEDAMN